MKENLQLEVDTIIQNSAGEVNSHQSTALARLIERKVLEGKIEEVKGITNYDTDIFAQSNTGKPIYRDERIADLTAQLNELEGREQS